MKPERSAALSEGEKPRAFFDPEDKPLGALPASTFRAWFAWKLHAAGGGRA